MVSYPIQDVMLQMLGSIGLNLVYNFEGLGVSWTWLIYILLWEEIVVVVVYI